MIRTIQLTVACAAVLVATTGQVQAGLMFTYTESEGNVVMTSSGTIDTSNLVNADHASWGSAGFQATFFDIMGGTTVGTTDTGFAFSEGTDFSSWTAGNPWNDSFFGFDIITGSKGFSTYVNPPIGNYLPGLQVLSSQLDGSLWTPDQKWTALNETFASLELKPGTYSVSDALTNETITYQIGAQTSSGQNGAQASAVPEPSSLAIFGIGGCVVGFGVTRRRRRESATKAAA